MNLKKLSLALAGIAALAFGASQPAMASVYAGSSLDISNLQIGIAGNTGTGLTGYTFTLANSATLNGLTTSTASTCNSLNLPGCNAIPGNPVLAADAANAPGSSPLRIDGALNNFQFFGPGSGQTYSNADSQINTAQVVNGMPTNTQQIAEAELAHTGTAQASTTVQSNTTFTFTFTIGEGGGGIFSMNFMADPDLFVAVNTAGLQGALAQANTGASFSLQSSNGTNIQWNPDGVVGNPFAACTGAVCVETADSQSLNNSLGLPAGNPQSNAISDARGGTDPGLTPFGITLTGLRSGNYTLVLAGTTSVNVVQVVPEPGILGLMGIGLLGLLGASRRRKMM